MQLLRKLYQSLKRQSLPNTYTKTSNLVLDIWWEIHETGNVTLLLKDKIKITQKVVDYCSEMWDSIKDQHISKYGMNDAYVEYLDKVYKLTALKQDYAITQDRMKKTFIAIAEKELEAITKGKQPNNSRDLWLVNSSINVSLDRFKSTVDDYFSCLSILEEKASYAGAN